MVSAKSEATAVQVDVKSCHAEYYVQGFFVNLCVAFLLLLKVRWDVPSHLSCVGTKRHLGHVWMHHSLESELGLSCMGREHCPQ